MQRKLYKIFEATLSFFNQGATSGITQYWLDDRYKNEYSIELQTATYNKVGNYLELVFFAKSTYGATDFVASQSVPQAPNGHYVLVIRFYKVMKILGLFFNPKKMDYPTLVNKLKQIIHTCDVKFYSDDPSFYFQGVFEDLAKSGHSIFKFPGPKGKNIWHNRHQAAGGLTNPYVRLTKHLTQVVRHIDEYINDIAKILKTK